MLSEPEISSFRPTSSGFDYQSFFANPSNFTYDERIQSVKYLCKILTEKPQTDSNALFLSFAIHFSDFVSVPKAIDDSVRIATFLLRENSKQYLSSFSDGATLLSNTSIELTSPLIDFFTELLIIPYSISKIHLIDSPVKIPTLSSQSAVHIRNSLFASFYVSDSDSVSKSYSLMCYLTGVSGSFLDFLCGTNASQYVPLIASVINRKLLVVTAAALTVLSRIFEQSNTVVKEMFTLK